MGFEKEDGTENSLAKNGTDSQVIVSKDNDSAQRTYLSYFFVFQLGEARSPVLLDKILIDNSSGVDYELIETYVSAEIPSLLSLNESRFQNYGFICEYGEELICRKEDGDKVYQLTAGKGDDDVELTVYSQVFGMH